MCGVLGIAAATQVVGELYDGLSTLQHRGQDAAGILTFDGEHVHSKRGNGLVRDVFRGGDIKRLTGTLGIGHVRYPTAGTTDAAEAQPFFVNAPFGIGLVHNGNITNTDKLRKQLNSKNIRHLNTQSDSEVLLNVLAEEIWHEKMKQISPTKLFRAVGRVMRRATGSYAAIALIAGQGLLAFRDPQGLRPLMLARYRGEARDDFLFASESVTPLMLEYELLGDLQPGEAAFVDLRGRLSRQQIVSPRWAPCIFEHVYLARPDAVIDDISVYKARLRMGEQLALEVAKAKLPIDVVVPVPDTSRTAALTLASALGVKYREGLIKNRYIGRTFIMPTQAARQKSIRHKLIPIELELRDKNVLLVDDSIVRGNTSRKLVELVREAGAKKVYLASASPALKWPCPYGVDMPTKAELIASGLTTEQVRKTLKADALFYLPLPGLLAACQTKKQKKEKKYCTACFDGKYPTKEITKKFIAEMGARRCGGCAAAPDTQLTLL